MAGPGGKEVGRVSVRVVPDTEKFREALRRQLAAETKGLEVEIPVRADTKNFRRQIEQAAKGARGSARVDADTSGIRRQVEDATRGLRGSVRLDVDRESYARALSAVRALGRGLAGLGHVGQGGLRAMSRTVVRTNEAMHSSLDRMSDGIRRHRNEVWDLTNKYRRMLPTIGRLRATMYAYDDILRRAGRSARQFGEDSVRNLRDLPNAARRGAQSMRDLGSAIDEQARYFRERDRDLSRFRSRMMAIKSALRDTVGEASGLNRVADAIRQMSNRDGDTSFLDRARAALRGLRQESQAADRGASDSEKNVDRTITYAGRKFLGLSRIGWIVTAVFLAAAPAIGIVSGLLSGLPSLLAAAGIAAGALYLGFDGIKKAASQLGPAFNEMKAAVSGVFEQRMTPMFAQLQTLMPMLTEGMKGVASGLSDMFQGVFDAITTGQGPAQIQTMLAGTASLFSSLQVPMQQITQGFLTLSAAGAQSFGHLSGSIGLFATKFNEMTARLTAFGGNSIFDGAMEGLSQTVDGVLELFGRLWEAGALAQAKLGAPLQNMFSGVADLLVSLMPALTSLSVVVANVIGELGSSLAPIITALTPAFQSFANIVQSLLLPAIQILGQVLTPIAEILGTILVQAFAALQPVIPPLVDAFSQVASILGGLLLQVLQQLQPFIPPLVTAFVQILQALLPLVPLFVQLAVTAIQPLIDALPELMPSIVKLAESFAELAVALAPIIGFVAQIMAKFAEFGASVLAAVVPVIAEIISQFANLVSGIAGFIGDVIEIGKKFPTDFKGALGDLGSLLLESGKALIQGFIDGIKAMLGKVKDAASSIVSAARDFFPFSPAKEGPFSGQGWVLYSGQSIGEAFAEGMTDQQKSVVNAAKSIMQAAKDVFGDTAQMGIVIMVGQFKDAIGEVADSAKDAKATVADNLSDTTANVTKSTKAANKDTKSSIAKVDDATKQRMDELELQATELDDLASLIEADAKRTKSKTNKAALEKRADDLREQADILKQEAKKLEYQAKYGKPYESIVDAAGGMGDEMQDQGLTVMQRLQKGMKNGLPGVLNAVKNMANDMGKVFGIEDVSGTWEQSMKDAKLDTLPEDFAKETKNQFVSDLGFGSGSGFLPQLIEQGTTQYNYYISDFEAAKQDERNQQARKSLQYTR
ncbi:hypothetical protein [Nocardia sp. IFM 10818]